MATDPMSYEVARSLVESGSVALSYQVLGLEAHRGVDGRYYSPYGIGHALYNVPFYLVGRALERWTGLDATKPEIVRKAVVVLGSAVAAALAVWIVFLFAATLTSDLRAATTTALVLGFATLLWPYAKFGFNAPLATLCVLAGAYGGWRAASDGGTGALVGAGAGVGAALLVRHELALTALPVAAVLALAHRGHPATLARRLAIFALPIGVAIAATLYYNWVRFGNPLDTGYLRDNTASFGSPWVGLMGLLLSPGRSVFLYSPVTLAGVAALGRLWRKNRALVILCGGELFVLLAFYASLTYWDADRSYGPRYLVPGLPFLVLPLTFWWRRDRESDEAGVGRGRLNTRARRQWALAALVGVSLAVQVPGVLVDFSKVGYTPDIGFHPLEERRWNWRLAGLTLNARAAWHAVPENWRYLTGAATPPRIRSAERVAPGFSEQLAFSLDFWWLYLFYLGRVSARTAALLGLASLAVTVACGWRLARALASHTPGAREGDRVLAHPEAVQRRA